MTKRILKLLMASVIMVVVGGILAIVFNPDTKVRKVELNNQESTYTLVETVAPKSMNQVAVKLNLKGERYYETRSSTPGRYGRNRTILRDLAYEIPIAVKVTRVRDGEVLVNHNHVFGLKPAEKKRVIHMQNKSEKSGIVVRIYPDLRIMVGTYPKIPRLDSPEELRFELTLEKDTTYGSWLESGNLEISQKDSGVGQAIGLSMVVLGVLSGLLFAFLLFIRLLLTTFSKKTVPLPLP